MSFAFRPRRTVFILASIWAVLVLMYGVTQFCKHKLGMHDSRQIVKFFDLDGKANIPQTFQAITLLAIAFLVFGIARHKKAASDPLAFYWKTLGFIFLFLTFDAICGIHNQMHVLGSASPEERRSRGIFYFSWPLGLGAIMLPIGIWYLRFLFRLPRKLATEIVVAGIIYVMGAMGMELVFNWFLSHGQVRLTVTLICMSVEESMEMTGELLMLYALLKHMAAQKITIGITAVSDATLAVARPAMASEPLLADDELNAALH